MKKTDQKNYILQAAVLSLGQMIADNARAQSFGHPKTTPPNVLTSETVRTLALLRPSAQARKAIGIHKDEERDDDEIRLRVLAFLAWRNIAEGNDRMAIHDVSSAVMTARKGSQHAQLLIAQQLW